MYIVLWDTDYGVSECKTFDKKEEVEDYLNNDKWFTGKEKKVFSATEQRIQKLQVESYIIEDKFRILP